MILKNKETVYKIVNENVLRTHLIIVNTSDATIYIDKEEHADFDNFEDNCVPFELNGLLEITGVECHKGAFYVTTDTDNTDVRVLEL